MKEIRIKRILYRSWYRGCKETDNILGWFFKKHIYEFNEDDLDICEEILDESDIDIFGWITGKKEIPEKYKDNKVVELLLSFNLADNNIE